MSANPMDWQGGVNPRIAEKQSAQSCMLPMGVTSENVAAKYGITREEQDKLAARSHARVVAAQKVRYVTTLSNSLGTMSGLPCLM